MFRSLNARLLLSHVTVILVCLVVAGLGLLLFVWASPLWSGMSFLRLEAAARATLPPLLRANSPEVWPTEALHAMLAQAASDHDVRILQLNEQSTVQFDSAAMWNGRQLTDAALQRVERTLTRGTLTAAAGGRWAFVGQTIPAAGGARQVILFIAPQSRLLALTWFAENLLPSLLQAGLVALLVSVLLAWLMARSVARPLQRVAAAAGAIARGDLEQRAPLSGPQEVRALAASFNQMTIRVAATQRAQRDLVANVSHDLKTPLTSVQGFSQAILDGTAGTPEAVARAAQVIHDEAGRMRWMIDELLSLARFDAGQVQMTRETVSLAAMLGECVERIRPHAEAAGNQLSLTVPPELTVLGDAAWLGQALVNLLDNAVQHTRNGRIEIVAQRTPRWVEVSVTDSGEGIPPQELERIFERFYRADKSRHHHGGVGLGLSITREVVRLHGGEISAESVVGLGSRFTVRLPVDGTEDERRKTNDG